MYLEARPTMIDAPGEAKYEADLRAGKVHRGNFETNKVFLEAHLQYLRQSKVLEIGCGAGHLTKWLLENGVDVIGVDRSANLINYARGGNLPNRFLVMDAQSLAFRNNCFDVVLSFDVLEHLPDVTRHLAEVRRVSKAGGRYLLQAPNKYTNAPYEIWKHKSLSHYRTYHCSLQTAASLAARFANSGFSCKFTKLDVRTDFFKDKVMNSFGVGGHLLMSIPYHKLPLFAVPNLYVVAELNH